ncbi:MAG: phosphate starvation-inducible protein PsiF [Hyphomicrobiaceae bacterium]|nr:phosphate starvation-inducible protein PsiF [Hyphomicrobiaceae bacterium]
MKTIISAVAAAFLLTSGAAFAADQAPATAAPATHATKTTKKPHTASVQSEKSKKCSSEADAQKLHGKERKAFRKSCMAKSA